MNRMDYQGNVASYDVYEIINIYLAICGINLWIMRGISECS